MLDKIPYDLYSIAATYLSAYDLKSLTQVSPLLRDVLAPSAWNLVYILPAGKDGSQQKLIEYIDYRFVDEVTFVNATKYGWFKRQYVHQIVFDHWCPLLDSNTINRIDFDQFANLRHIKAQALPIYWVNHNNKVELKHGIRYSTLDSAVLFSNDAAERQVRLKRYPVINMEYPFTRKITSGSFHAKYTIHLMVSSIYHWQTICNHTLITHLNLTFLDVPYLMDSLIAGLRRCVNVEWLTIKLDKIFQSINSSSRQKYLDLMPIYKSLKKLRYLQTSNMFRTSDPMLMFDCIVNDLDESVYYEYQIDMFLSRDITFNDNRETMTFPCVKALEIRVAKVCDNLASSGFQFRALFPNLQHLSLGLLTLGDYLNDMVGSFAEGLQTLKLTVSGVSDMVWLIRTIPKFKSLRVLQLTEWKFRSYGGPEYLYEILHKCIYFSYTYHDHGAKYDDLLKYIVSGGANASLQQIRTWKPERVKEMVLSAIANSPNVEDGEIDYMVKLILDPEALVCEFEPLQRYARTFVDFFNCHTYNTCPRLQYVMSYYYAVWESIFMKCQQLKKLEKLTIDGVWQPFISPGFEELVCKHDTLKRVMIYLSGVAEPLNLSQAKYSRFITRRVTPVTGYYLAMREKKINGFCHTYLVDVEGFRKQYAREIYKEGDYEDVEYTALGTSKQITMTERQLLIKKPILNIEEGSYRLGQDATTWDFGIQSFYSYPF